MNNSTTNNVVTTNTTKNNTENAMSNYPLNYRNIIKRNFNVGDGKEFITENYTRFSVLDELGSLRTELEDKEYNDLRGDFNEYITGDKLNAKFIAPCKSEADMNGIDLILSMGLPVQVKSSLLGFDSHVEKFLAFSGRNWIPCVVGTLSNADEAYEVLMELLEFGVYVAKDCRKGDWKRCYIESKEYNKSHRPLTEEEIVRYTA